MNMKRCSCIIILALVVSITLSSCNSDDAKSDVSSIAKSSFAKSDPTVASSEHSQISGTEVLSDEYQEDSSVVSSQEMSNVGSSAASSAPLEEPYPFLQTYPQDGGYILDGSRLLKWTESKYAEKYMITIAEDSSFSNIVGQFESSVNQYEIKVPLFAHRKYYWRVKAVNASGTANSFNDSMAFVFLPDLKKMLDDYMMTIASEPRKKPISEGELYSPVNTTTWDYWFAENNNQYHAFHLERQNDKPSDYIAVGHAVSDDLLKWDYYGTVIQAESGRWDDLRIATGSTVKNDEIWYTYYTGHSTADPGFGLSISKDLFNWMKVGNEAIIPASRRFSVKWKNMEYDVGVSADPYVFPEKINGWHYMFANASVLNIGKGFPGCILLLRSRDLLNWESVKIVAHTGEFLRMETPQVWTRNGIWYLYFGGVRLRSSVDPSLIDPKIVFNNGEQEIVSNYIFTSSDIDGDYSEQNWSNISLPDGKPFYICKFMNDTVGNDVMLTTYWGVWKLSKPYGVTYDNDGTVVIR